MGPQGPAGINGVSGYVSFPTDYLSQSIGASTSVWFLSLCPSGRAVGGGYELLNGGGAQLTAIASHPYQLGTTFGWRIQVRNNTGLAVTASIRVHAVCATVQ
jgi:hypothetical protein